jgi:FdhD protein
MPLSDPVGQATAQVFRRKYAKGVRPVQSRRVVPEETPVAFSYNGSSYAVMMATAQDLADFAYGFSLTEGIITTPSDIETLEIVEHDMGLELQMRLVEEKAAKLVERHRAMAGPTGCGLCGVESLEDALRVLPQMDVDEDKFSADQIKQAIAAIGPLQTLNQQTHAVHAAAFWTPQAGIVALREDVGRHNALDKLIGALARGDIKTNDGILVMTSRVSIELVQKAAMTGISVMVAISAPTALAVRSAGFAGITLVAVAREDGFEVFTHHERITTDATNGR